MVLGFPSTKFVSANSRFTNPTSLMLKQAQDVFGSGQHIACIVSLGSGQREPVSVPINRASDSDDWAKLAQDAERNANDMARRCGEAKDFFFRLNVTHDLEGTSTSPDFISIIASHTSQYLRHSAVEHELDQLVRILCKRPACFTTERLNSILGSNARDQVLEAVKEMHADTKLQHGINQDDRYHDIVNWLSPNHSVHSSLQECRQNREEGTGSWLLKSDKFSYWRSGAVRLLILQGIPGGGKTILTSIIYDQLENRLSGDSDVKVLGAFISYGVTRTVEDILSCLLCQLLDNGNGQVAPDVEALYKKRSNGRPSTDDILPTLHSRLSQSSRAYIVLDALDEFPSDSRQKLLDTLLNISPDVSLFVTSRPISYSIAANVSQNLVYMDASEPDDLECFVKNRIKHDERLSWLLSDSQDLSELVLNTVLMKCSNLFLLARFHMDELAKYRTPVALTNALLSLPTTASAKYEITLDRIRQQPGTDGTYALHALMWMSLARSDRNNWYGYEQYKRWSIGELVHAIASSSNELGENGTTALSERDIVDVCLGLVVVIYGYVSFVHLTAQEHFQIYFSKVNEDHFRDAHYTLTAGCLRYLAAPRSPEIVFNWFRHHQDLSRKYQSPIIVEYDAWGFFKYCAKNWSSHVRQILAHGDGNKKIFFQIFSYSLQFDFSERATAKQEYADCNICGEDLKLVTALRKASLLSTCSCLLLVIEANSPNSLWQGSSLSLASEKGYFELVECLLSCPNSEVAANVTKDDNGRSPLSYAAQNGHQNVVKLFLIKPGVEVDSRDNDGQSPLSYAAENGHLDVVKLLLGRSDVEMDSRDREGRSPLTLAAMKGHRSTVEVFLSHLNVNINICDINGRSPLSYAAEQGQLDVVKLLLSRLDVDPNSRDVNGQSPLTSAAQNGHESIVKLFLSHPNLDADNRDKSGRSPLSYAAENGRLNVAELLIGHLDVETDSRDICGLAPLTFAAKNGRRSIVEILLNSPNVDINKCDDHGRSPLLYAALYGHLCAVELLLSKPDVEPDSRDIYGRSPFFYAVVRGNLGILDLLLHHQTVNADPRDTFGRSPLEYSMQFDTDKDKAIRELLSRPRHPTVCPGSSRTG